MHADLQNYEIPFDAPRDAALQAQLESLDKSVAAELDLSAGERAIGVLDLNELRLAMIDADNEFYGASVPKIIIALGYLEKCAASETPIDDTQMLELGRMIRESDNDLAAKYSQLAGLEYLQSIVQTSRYRLYDRNHGGGLWCGKLYGVAQPRIGDPIADHSHAATVRQCLRFYLMLEQDRLGNPSISARLRQIFATPWLYLHPDNFVRGLAGRDLSILRKGGTWEDWHLDTARVRHGDRVYLLAGMVKHAKGTDYLARMAAGIDTLLCGEHPPVAYQHRLWLQETFEDVRFSNAASDDAAPVRSTPDGEAILLRDGATYESPIVLAPVKFNELVLSWNADVPPQSGMTIELRAGRRIAGTWTPWLTLADWGDAPPSGEHVTIADHARIDVDYFRSDELFDRAQYRIRVNAPAGGIVRVERAALCFSDLTGLPDSMPRARRIPIAVDPSRWQRKLPVPWRSQKSERADIAGKICSPTSVAMVMEYRGATRTTLDVASTALDPTNKIYGNWPRNVQAAYSLGVPGYLTRFSEWTDVERCIARGQPLVISVRVKDKGGLRGAPYQSTDGHLIVLCGFDTNGMVEINDPAASTPERGVVKYHREDLEKYWMRASGGLAYVLLESSQRVQ